MKYKKKEGCYIQYEKQYMTYEESCEKYRNYFSMSFGQSFKSSKSRWLKYSDEEDNR